MKKNEIKKYIRDFNTLEKLRTENLLGDNILIIEAIEDLRYKFLDFMEANFKKADDEEMYDYLYNLVYSIETSETIYFENDIETHREELRKGEANE